MEGNFGARGGIPFLEIVNAAFLSCDTHLMVVFAGMGYLLRWFWHMQVLLCRIPVFTDGER